MRLLNTKTFEFKEFYGSVIPKYAILSHRWGEIEEEVSYKQFRKGSVPPDLPGILKIRNFCRLAAESFQWAWVDTCCIDKRSSAELSEAINSMYNWYRDSEVCYVHLADVEFSARELSVMNQSGDAFWNTAEGWPSFKEKFRKSCWFERGWTLQELIAPKKVVFYDAHWNLIFPLEHFYQDIAQVTGIDKQWLAPFNQRRPNPSVATRMSWASHRKTSREEDLIYCLLGLLNVNMPLLYGEGAEKAFYRLQTEIMKTSDDESLFAWTSDQPISGLLAANPRCFADSADIMYGGKGTRPPYSMTNKGLEIAIPKKHLFQWQMRPSTRLFLRCSRGYHNGYTNYQKALYVKLYQLDGLCMTRTNCAILQEAETSPNGGQYLLSQLEDDLIDTERIYIQQAFNSRHAI